MKQKLYILLVLFSLPLLTRAQDSAETSAPKFKMPVIGFSQGVMNFNGDIGYDRLNQPLWSRSGFQLEIQNHTENRLSFGVYILSGRLLGEDNSDIRNLNFKSSIVAEGIRVRYELLSNRTSEQVLIPYITAGIEYLSFKSKADLKDANGNPYHYWSDGSIKNMDENDPNAANAVDLHRDYVYETSIRDANLDGFGKYKESCFSVPVGVGVRFKISSKTSLDFSTMLHMAMTDYIDGITSNGTEGRMGNNKNDKFFFTSVGFKIDLGAEPDYASKGSRYIPDVRGVDFNALARDDADGDGIPDVADDSSGTPEANQVDAKGKPLDKDDDGIPDYRDKELNSAAYAVVNEDGVTITEEMIEEQFRKDSLAALPAVIEYLHAYDKLSERKPDIEEKWTQSHSTGEEHSIIPDIYKRLDIDGNGYITPKEISGAIDEYMAQRSPYSVQEFFDLIDFFFSQK
ncbi:MAG: hypothetical protein U0X76_03885 [Bacteroidia bacterium]